MSNEKVKKLFPHSKLTDQQKKDIEKNLKTRKPGRIPGKDPIEKKTSGKKGK